METKTELKKVKEIISEILANDIRARNDDKYLTFLVMRRFTNIYINFEDFKKIPAFESIKRIRAVIQNKEKLYLPTDEKVINRRWQRQQEVKQFVR